MRDKTKPKGRQGARGENNGAWQRGVMPHQKALRVIPDEVAEYIYHSLLPNHVLVARLGIAMDMICHIRLGWKYKEIAEKFKNVPKRRFNAVLNRKKKSG